MRTAERDQDCAARHNVHLPTAGFVDEVGLKLTYDISYDVPSNRLTESLEICRYCKNIMVRPRACVMCSALATWDG